jgi:DNA-binding MarR family transcriptional regulator
MKSRGQRASGDPTRLSIYRVWRAENALSRMFDEALRPLGVSVAQCAVLFHLDLHGALSAADLSRLIHVTPQGIASTVRRLAQSGWIDRRPHPVHGRIVLLGVTENGRRVLGDALRIADEVDERVTRGLADGDRVALTRALDHMQARTEARA